MIRYLTLITILFVTVAGVYAQSPVTRDDVDAVASRMFCPICENEPLDQCYNTTCIQWKTEIAELLAEGNTPDEIIDSFVARYGEHVASVPRDPVLRFLSFSAPVIGTLIAIVIGLMTFTRWRRRDPVTESEAIIHEGQEVDHYRSQIERDLN